MGVSEPALSGEGREFSLFMQVMQLTQGVETEDEKRINVGRLFPVEYFDSIALMH